MHQVDYADIIIVSDDAIVARRAARMTDHHVHVDDRYGIRPRAHAPVTDGTRVYCWFFAPLIKQHDKYVRFGNLVAFDQGGRRLWDRWIPSAINTAAAGEPAALVLPTSPSVLLEAVPDGVLVHGEHVLLHDDDTPDGGADGTGNYTLSFFEADGTLGDPADAPPPFARWPHAAAFSDAVSLSLGIDLPAANVIYWAVIADGDAFRVYAWAGDDLGVLGIDWSPDAPDEASIGYVNADAPTRSLRSVDGGAVGMGHRYQPAVFRMQPDTWDDAQTWLGGSFRLHFRGETSRTISYRVQWSADQPHITPTADPGHVSGAIRIPAHADAVMIERSFAVGGLSLVRLESDQDVTLRTNDDEMPTDTIILRANTPLSWQRGDGADCPFTSAVSEIFVDNDSDDDATIAFTVMFDVPSSLLGMVQNELNRMRTITTQGGDIRFFDDAQDKLRAHGARSQEAFGPDDLQIVDHDPLGDASATVVIDWVQTGRAALHLWRFPSGETISIYDEFGLVDETWPYQSVAGSSATPSLPAMPLMALLPSSGCTWPAAPPARVQPIDGASGGVTVW